MENIRRCRWAKTKKMKKEKAITRRYNTYE